MSETKHAGGRPTLYTPELAQLICDKIATQRHGLKKICDMYDELPDHETVKGWKLRYPEFLTRYLQAKKDQINVMMDEIDETIDENLLYYTDDKGNRRIDSPSATIALAKANNRKWFASKLAPKYYGTNTDDTVGADDTLTKIRDLVNDFNKTNTSDI